MTSLSFNELHAFLDEKYNRFNVPGFITDDPVSIPHGFERKEDIEISGFLTATLAWGNRKAIISNSEKLMKWMGYYPHEFITNATEKDFLAFDSFVYRTFNGTDILFFLKALQNIYLNHGGLENVFTDGYQKEATLKSAITHFRTLFIEVPHQNRSEKHLANVMKNSSGKRVCMFLRWMVRNDGRGVDFGIWKNIPASKLMLPLDLHTGTVSRKLMLLNRNANDWKAVEEVTSKLAKFDPNDPVKYDFALFGLGVNKEL